MQSLFLAAVLLTNLFLPNSWLGPVPSQDALFEVKDAQVFYQFGNEITFQAQIAPLQGSQEVSLTLQPEGAQPLLVSITPNAQGGIIYHLDLKEQSIRPGSRIYYWYQIKDENGDQTSPSFWFDYFDNRFTWQMVENQHFKVYWYEGTASFGQDALNTAEAGLRSVENFLPLVPPTPMKVFIYSNVNDFQSAMQLSGQSWASGYASPDLGSVMVSISPGPEQNLELERQIPHETAHVLLYQSTGTGYSKLPTWLVEGVASVSELYANPDYQRTLEIARDNHTLLPISDLCQPFPRDASGAFLAYAESASFTRFLYKNYGTTGLQSLVDQYMNGLGCSEAVQAAFGVPLAQLDRQWQAQNLNINTNRIALMNFAPYIFLLIVLATATLLIPLIFKRSQNPGTGGKQV